ncbi:MAG TPA: DsbA family protein [Solirubrobacteraceae bacterium]|nr:DsbA family protein [Solirubrobacteraceae bacterium]
MQLPPPVDPERDHVRGPDGTPALLMYGDYECPYTRAAYRVTQALERRGTPFRLAFRHFPLTHKHPHALIAAVAAEAAAELGAFWPMHDALMHHQDALEIDDLRRYAVDEAGLDAERYEVAFGSDAQMDRIREDVQGGAAAGVDGTPRIFLDGELLPSYEAGWLRGRLEAAATA